MTADQVAAPAVIAAGVIGGAKLILVGACLAVGFAAGNVIVTKAVDSYVKLSWAVREKLHREPPEEADGNGGLQRDAKSEEAGS